MADITRSMEILSSDSAEFKLALKILIKYEIHCLLQRLSVTGEEAIVITTSISDGVHGHLATTKGEGFLEQADRIQQLKEQFHRFCAGNDDDFDEAVVIKKELPDDYDDDDHSPHPANDTDGPPAKRKRTNSSSRSTKDINQSQSIGGKQNIQTSSTSDKGHKETNHDSSEQLQKLLQKWAKDKEADGSKTKSQREPRLTGRRSRAGRTGLPTLTAAYNDDDDDVDDTTMEDEDYSDERSDLPLSDDLVKNTTASGGEKSVPEACLDDAGNTELDQSQTRPAEIDQSETGSEHQSSDRNKPDRAPKSQSENICPKTLLNAAGDKESSSAKATSHDYSFKEIKVEIDSENSVDSQCFITNIVSNSEKENTEKEVADSDKTSKVTKQLVDSANPKNNGDGSTNSSHSNEKELNESDYSDIDDTEDVDNMEIVNFKTEGENPDSVCVDFYFCDNCSFSTLNVFDFDRHKMNCTEATIQSCPFCNRYFLSKAPLEAHLATDHSEYAGEVLENQNLVTGIDSGKSSNSNSNTQQLKLKLGTVTHLNLRGTSSCVVLGRMVFFSCNVCKIFFTSNDSLLEHTLGVSHTEKVKNCEASITDPYPLLKNTTELENDILFQCSECTICYPKVYLLYEHCMNRHPHLLKDDDSPRPSISNLALDFHCTKCDKVFHSRHYLKTHWRNLHSTRCPICKEAFEDAKLMQKHLKGSHPKCKICVKRFLNLHTKNMHKKKFHSTKKLALKNSVQTSPSKVFKKKNSAAACQYCGKKFERNLLLKRHQLSFHPQMFANTKKSYLGNAGAALNQVKGTVAIITRGALGKTVIVKKGVPKPAVSRCLYCPMFFESRRLKGHLWLKHRKEMESIHNVETRSSKAGIGFSSRKKADAEKLANHDYAIPNKHANPIPKKKVRRCDAPFETSTERNRQISEMERSHSVETRSSKAGNSSASRTRAEAETLGKHDYAIPYKTPSPVHEKKVYSYRCNDCDALFETSTERNRHIRAAHAVSPDGYSYGNLLSALAQTVTDAEKKHTCILCTPYEQFRSHKELLSHLSVRHKKGQKHTTPQLFIQKRSETHNTTTVYVYPQPVQQKDAIVNISPKVQKEFQGVLNKKVVVELEQLQFETHTSGTSESVTLSKKELDEQVEIKKKRVSGNRIVSTPAGKSSNSKDKMTGEHSTANETVEMEGIKKLVGSMIKKKQAAKSEGVGTPVVKPKLVKLVISDNCKIVEPVRLTVKVKKNENKSKAGVSTEAVKMMGDESTDESADTPRKELKLVKNDQSKQKDEVVLKLAEVKNVVKNNKNKKEGGLVSPGVEVTKQVKNNESKLKNNAPVAVDVIDEDSSEKFQDEFDADNDEDWNADDFDQNDEAEESGTEPMDYLDEGTGLMKPKEVSQHKAETVSFTTLKDTKQPQKKKNQSSKTKKGIKSPKQVVVKKKKKKKEKEVVPLVNSDDEETVDHEGVCQFCGFVSVTTENLEWHMNNTCAIKKTLRCSFCELTFLSEIAFIGHLKDHPSCNLCSKRCASLMARTAHKSQVHPKCVICKQRFLNLPDVLSHLKTVHDKTYVENYKSLTQAVNVFNMYECSECNGEFISWIYLKNHQKRDHPKLIFSRPPRPVAEGELIGPLSDEYRFTGRYNKDPVKCQHCDVTFLSKYILVKHIAAVHTVQEPLPVSIKRPRAETHKCVYCKAFVKNEKNALLEHYRAGHPTTPIGTAVRMRYCPFCDHEIFKNYYCVVLHAYQFHKDKWEQFQSTTSHEMSKISCHICGLAQRGIYFLFDHFKKEHQEEIDNSSKTDQQIVEQFHTVMKKKKNKVNTPVKIPREKLSKTEVAHAARNMDDNELRVSVESILSADSSTILHDDDNYDDEDYETHSVEPVIRLEAMRPPVTVSAGSNAYMRDYNYGGHNVAVETVPSQPNTVVYSEDGNLLPMVPEGHTEIVVSEVVVGEGSRSGQNVVHYSGLDLNNVSNEEVVNDGTTVEMEPSLNEEVMSEETFRQYLLNTLLEEATKMT